MKAFAIFWYGGITAIALWNFVGTPTQNAINVAMGVLLFHAVREIREWLD